LIARLTFIIILYCCWPYQYNNLITPFAGQRIALDVARGLSFFHTHDILHLDIKSPNILLASGGAKIADLGLGIKVKEGEAVHSEPTKSPDYSMLLHALVTMPLIS